MRGAQKTYSSIVASIGSCQAGSGSVLRGSKIVDSPRILTDRSLSGEPLNKTRNLTLVPLP